jgi:hypothetical protein
LPMVASVALIAPRTIWRASTAAGFRRSAIFRLAFPLTD